MSLTKTNGETGMFANKHILVTGASRGIGLAVAEAFLKESGEVSILASSDSVHEVADKLGREHGRSIAAIQCDIRNPDEVRRQLASLGQIDVLINNAGLELITPIEDLSDDCADRFKQIIDINVLGTYHVTRFSLPKMVAGGRIIITSSIWGKTAVAEFSAYCASKHANLGFMRSLAHELAHRDITVNAVCPGWVKTVAAMRSLKALARKAKVSEQEMLAGIVSNQALGGLLKPSDVVGPYLFLASEMAADITGQSLNIDRGEVMM